MRDYKKSVNYFLNNSCEGIQELMKEFNYYLEKLPAKRSTKRSANTNYGILTSVYKYLESIKKNIESINHDSIYDYIEQFKAKGTVWGRLKPFLKFLKQKKLMSEQLFEELIIISFKDGIRKKKFALSKNRWSEAYNQLSGVKKFSVWLLFHTGIRVGELITLEYENFEINHIKKEYFLKIYPKKIKMKEKTLNWYPKSDKSIREIPLSENMIEIIEEYFKYRRIMDFEHNFLIYVTKNGNGVKRGDPIKYGNTIRAWMTNIYLDFPEDPNKKCNVKIGRHRECEYSKPHKHIAPHHARYSYASHIYYSGRDNGMDVLDEVGKLLGHANAQVTYEYLELDKKTEVERKKRSLALAGL